MSRAAKPDCLQPLSLTFGYGYRQVLCANSFTSLAELSLHRAGKPALNYLVAEDRERVKGGETTVEYDLLGRIIAITDPMGAATAYSYDIRVVVNENGDVITVIPK